MYGELPWLAGECMEVGERCCAAAADDSDVVKGLWGGELMGWPEYPDAM